MLNLHEIEVGDTLKHVTGKYYRVLYTRKPEGGFPLIVAVHTVVDNSDEDSIVKNGTRYHRLTYKIYSSALTVSNPTEWIKA